MSFRYSDEHIAFLRKGFKKMRIPELTAAFNEEFGTDRVESSIRAAIKNRKNNLINMGALCGATGILVHSFVSVNMRFAVSSIWAFMLLGLALNADESECGTVLSFDFKKLVMLASALQVLPESYRLEIIRLLFLIVILTMAKWVLVRRIRLRDFR